MRFSVFALLLLFTGPLLAQSLSSSVGLFVYPAQDQNKEKQEQDDYQCYAWAKDQSNFDPMNTREPAEVVAQNPGMDGSGARGALRGAARGALLGQVIDDDAGKGAAIGATLGAMRSRSRARQQAQYDAASRNNDNQSAYLEKKGGFKKAMSLCLEARGYSVK